MPKGPQRAAPVARNLYNTFAATAADVRLLCAEVFRLRDFPCDPVEPQVRRLAELAELAEEEVLGRLNCLVDSLGGAAVLQGQGKAPLFRKKPWKKDRLRDVDIKAEKELGLDRVRMPRRKARSGRQPVMLDATEKWAHMPDGRPSPGWRPMVVLPRQRYETLVSRERQAASAPPGLQEAKAASTPSDWLPVALPSWDEATEFEAAAEAAAGLAAAAPPPPPPPPAELLPKLPPPPLPDDEELLLQLQALLPEPELVSVLLSRRAAEEAELCVRPDGTLDTVRLRAAIAGSSERLARQVLGRLPHKLLLQLVAEPDKALGFSVRPLLRGDVLNSALLAEDGRRRKAWSRRSLPEEGTLPAAVPRELSSSMQPLFCPRTGALVGLVQRRLDSEEQRHPSIVPKFGENVVVPHLDTFKVLLSLFSDGLLDGFPWGCKGAVLGGSGVLACLALPPDLLARNRRQLQLVAALRQSATTKHALVAALHKQPGSRQVAKLILQFVGSDKEAMGGLEDLKEGWFHNESRWTPYNSADIDLYFIASSKAEALESMAKARRVLQKSITAFCSEKGASEPQAACVTIRTPNSVTLCPRFPLRHVQLVLRIAEDLSEHVGTADLDCTALGFDGKNVLAAPRAFRALETGYNLVSNKMFCQRKEVPERVAKYAQRGFGTMVFELCRHEPRCDVKLDEKTEGKLKYARGLTNQRRRNSGFVRRDAMDDETDRDVAIDLLAHGYDHLRIPRGPDVSPEAVRALLELKDSELMFVLEEGQSWQDLVEWRREKRPQPMGGDDAEPRPTRDGAGPCYCCGEQCAAEWPTPAESDAAAAEEPTTPTPGPPSPAEGSPREEGRGKEKKRVLVAMCRCCRDENSLRREQVEDLRGYTAVVTGGRCKIGFEACLRLLRCGCRVVASTRFPRCAAEGFLKEPDAEQWLERLHIYGVDFTHLGLMQAFIAQAASHYSVDILVNNAAQTIRRPPAYYSKLFERERALYLEGGGDIRRLVRDLGVDPWRKEPVAELQVSKQGSSAAAAAEVVRAGLAWAPGSADGSNVPALLSAAMTLTSQGGQDIQVKNEELFPDRADLHGEQLDLRSSHTWTSTLCRAGGVEGRELLEVLAVNAAAPFLIFQGLLPALRRPRGPDDPQGRFVVNVTSAEGIFSADGAAAKSAEHPHTNMAKAALNMLTKTAASELAQLGVYCTAVDPGWVSMMRPGEPLLPGRPLPPLSSADGAARVLAPILDGLKALRGGTAPPHGVLLRNFAVAPW